TTNAFPSATNTFDFTNSYQLLITATSASVTNLSSVSNAFVNLGMLMVSNISATNITLTVTVPYATAVGAQSSSTLTIAPSTKGWVKFLAYGNVFTNYACDTDAGTLATQTYVNNATNRAITINGTAVYLGQSALAPGA